MRLSSPVPLCWAPHSKESWAGVSRTPALMMLGALGLPQVPAPSRPPFLMVKHDHCPSLAGRRPSKQAPICSPHELLFLFQGTQKPSPCLLLPLWQHHNARWRELHKAPFVFRLGPHHCTCFRYEPYPEKPHFCLFSFFPTFTEPTIKPSLSAFNLAK